MIKVFLLTILFQFPEQSGYVNDYAEFLSEYEQKKLEQRLQSIDHELGIEITLVTVQSLGNKTPPNYATEIGSQWDIKKNSIVIIVSKDEQEFFIATSNEVSKDLPSTKTQEIVNKYAIPLLKNGSYVEGIVKSLDVLIGKLIDISEEKKEDSYIDKILPFGVLGLFVWVFYQGFKTKYQRKKQFNPWENSLND